MTDRQEPRVYALAMEVPAGKGTDRFVTALCFLEKQLSEAKIFGQRVGYKAQVISEPLTPEQERRAVDVLKSKRYNSLDEAIKYIQSGEIKGKKNIGEKIHDASPQRLASPLELTTYGIIFIDNQGKVRMTTSNGTIADYIRASDFYAEKGLRIKYANPRLNDEQDDIMIGLANRLETKPEISESELTETISRLREADTK